MDVQSVLIGALLMDDQLAPYSLPELSIEHFRPELIQVGDGFGFLLFTENLDLIR